MIAQLSITGDSATDIFFGGLEIAGRDGMTLRPPPGQRRALRRIFIVMFWAVIRQVHIAVQDVGTLMEEHQRHEGGVGVGAAYFGTAAAHLLSIGFSPVSVLEPLDSGPLRPVFCNQRSTLFLCQPAHRRP